MWTRCASVLALLVAVSVVLSPPAGAAVMDFEDLYGYSPQNPALWTVDGGYEGFSWHSWVFAIEGRSGQLYTELVPAIRGEVGMYNGWGNQFGLMRMDQTTWTFNSAYIGGLSGRPVRFTGYDGSGQLTYDVTLSGLQTGGQSYTFDWVDIRNVWIDTSEPGTNGQLLLMDDIRYNEPVGDSDVATPELSTWALLACSGILGLGVLRRRRKA